MAAPRTLVGLSVGMLDHALVETFIASASTVDFAHPSPGTTFSRGDFQQTASAYSSERSNDAMLPSDQLRHSLLGTFMSDDLKEDREWQMRREGAVIFIAEHTRHGQLAREAFERAWDSHPGAGHDLLEDLISTARATVSNDGNVHLDVHLRNWLKDASSSDSAGSSSPDGDGQTGNEGTG